MINTSSNPDVIVVGAGAAGIGAGLVLARLGVTHVILESKHRVGGRAYSEASSIGHLWDHGCHWFHSADVNVLRFMAEKIGHQFPAHEKDGLAQLFTGGKWERTPVKDYFIWDVLAKVAAQGRAGKDVAVETLLDRAEERYPLIRHWCQLVYSMDPENISVGDSGNYSDSDVNLPVEAGYGALIEKMSQNLPVRLNTQVISIEVLPNGVRVQTSQGQIEAKACIVSVPARVLETQGISFTPALPATVVQALQDVPMGWYEKVAIAFDQPLFKGFDYALADIFEPASFKTKPLTFEVQPFDRPIVIAHLGGSVAKDMVAQGDAAMKAFALETLVKAFGSAIQKRVVASATSQWTADPMIGGAYSCAKPGLAHARKVFSETIHDRIFLAGEHVHKHYMATCHGAYETGLEAGHKAATAAGYAPKEKDPLWLPS